MRFFFHKTESRRSLAAFLSGVFSLSVFLAASLVFFSCASQPSGSSGIQGGDSQKNEPPVEGAEPRRAFLSRIDLDKVLFSPFEISQALRMSFTVAFADRAETTEDTGSQAAASVRIDDLEFGIFRAPEGAEAESSDALLKLGFALDEASSSFVIAPDRLKGLELSRKYRWRIAERSSGGKVLAGGDFGLNLDPEDEFVLAGAYRKLYVALGMPPDITRFQRLLKTEEFSAPPAPDSWAQEFRWSEQRLYHRFTLPSGVAGPEKALATYREDDGGELRALFPLPGEVFYTYPLYFDWEALPGADYSLALNFIKKDGSSESRNFAGKNSFLRIPETALPPLNQVRELRWSVEARSRGKSYRSPERTTVPGSGFPEFVSLLLTGEEAVFVRGRSGKVADEGPPHEIELTRPFSVAVSNLTTALFVDLMNRRLRRGEVLIRDGKILSVPQEKALFGLAELDFGNQWGVSVQTGLLSARTGKENHPVTGISWYGALLICNELNYSYGLGPSYREDDWSPREPTPGAFRLPTEAEWEYANSRGGRSPSPWGAEPNSASANYLRSRDVFEDLVPPYTAKGGPTVPSGYFVAARSQAFSAYRRNSPQDRFPEAQRLDSIGNVWEWCSDWYDETYYAALVQNARGSPILDPLGPEALRPGEAIEREARGLLPSKAVRGGAWNSGLDELYAQNRGKFPPERTSFSLGMRLLRTPESPEASEEDRSD